MGIMLTRTVSLVALFTIAACSSSGGGGAGAGSSDDGGGGGGGGQGGGNGGACAETFVDVVAPQKLSPNSAIYRQIIVDGSTLFLRSNAQIGSAPSSGGPFSTVFGKLGSDDTQTDNMWLDGASVLFESNTAFESVPKSGGTVATIATDGTQALVHGSAHDSGGFYYLADRVSGMVLLTLPASGGAPKTLVDLGKVTASSLFVDDGYLYWIQDSHGGTGSLMRVATGGGTPKSIGTAMTGLSSVADAYSGALAFDDHYLYFVAPSSTNPFSGTVQRIAKDGSGAAQPVAPYGADYLVVRDGMIWGLGINEYSPGNPAPLVWRATSDGQSAKVLACVTDGNTTHALAVDADSAYVAITDGNSGESKIAKVAR